MKQKKYLKVKDIADMLGLSILTVYEYIKRGEVQAIKLGRNYRVERSEFDKFIKRHTT
jgi:excisionase family DNA binding protein